MELDDSTCVRRAAVVTDRADALTVHRLREGDEVTFVSIMTSWSPAMLRLARVYVRTSQSAEDVVQDTWLAVLAGLDGFQERSALRTWVLGILVNKAKSCALREHKVLPTDVLDSQGADPAVSPDRFRGPEDRWPGHWRVFPERWPVMPEDEVLSGELRQRMGRALESLPRRQREVIELRDVYGYSADETCWMLDISAVNQRVLLHRARARMRASIEEYLRSAVVG
ncbi:sigma-70 family RNA polymerase sigma factor [Streptomyces sp. NPDC047082]|uniref:RNA polymerase sigma factor n=1 Tax=Streptomyces sp. NPDC047082 TaxID=3155259 RepID=UPI0033D03146